VSHRHDRLPPASSAEPPNAAVENSHKLFSSPSTRRARSFGPISHGMSASGCLLRKAIPTGFPRRQYTLDGPTCATAGFTYLIPSHSCCPHRAETRQSSLVRVVVSQRGGAESRVKAPPPSPRPSVDNHNHTTTTTLERSSRPISTPETHLILTSVLSIPLALADVTYPAGFSRPIWHHPPRPVTAAASASAPGPCRHRRRHRPSVPITQFTLLMRAHRSNSNTQASFRPSHHRPIPFHSLVHAPAPPSA
jgi:hypothetical protein